MLLLILILCIIGMVFVNRKRKKNESKHYKVILSCLSIAALVLILNCLMILLAFSEINNSQKKIDTLTVVNKQMTNWIETDKLSNNVEEYLNSEIDSNNEEILKYERLKSRKSLYRWLLYFG